MMTAQVVARGCVVNTIHVDETATVSADHKTIALPTGSIRAADVGGEIIMIQPGAGIGWNLVGSSLVAPEEHPPQFTVDQLRAYASAKASALLTSARDYSVEGVKVKSDAASLTIADLTSLAKQGASKPTETQSWIDNDYNVTEITGDKAVALAQAVSDYVQTIYAEFATVLKGIAAGTINSPQAIERFSWTV